MNEPLSEELLSAYLDGELPGEERTHVEAWLASSAEHRRLLDDLQAIRRELQALPKQTLDAGFSDRVLAGIRERQAGNRATPSPQSSPGTDAAVAAEGHPPMPKTVIRPIGIPAW